MIGDLARWFVSDSITFSPLGFVGCYLLTRWLADGCTRWARTDVIELPDGTGAIGVRGATPAVLAEICERTGGAVRPMTVLDIARCFGVPVSMIDGRPWVPTRAEADADGEDDTPVG